MKKIIITFSILFILCAVSVNAQTPFRGNLTIGYSLPLGDFSKVYKGGVSAEGGLYFTIPIIGLDLTLTAGYNAYKYKNEYFTDLVKSNINVVVDNFNYSWTATDIPIMVGVRYKLPLLSIKPYFTGEAGLHYMTFSDRFNGQRIIGNSSSTSSLNFNNTIESGSSIGVGTAIGGGLEIPLIPKINLDLNIKYNYASNVYSKSYEVFINNNSKFTTTEMKNINYITVRGGVVVDF